MSLQPNQYPSSLGSSGLEYLSRPVPITDTRMPVIGWRWWREKGGSLFSIVKNFSEWPKREPMVVDDPNWHLDGHGPNGIHAYLLKKQLYVEDAIGSNLAGSVFMWGRVCQHTGGFTAEYAYPRSFLVPPSMDPLKVMELEDGYGVKATMDEELFRPENGVKYLGQLMRQAATLPIPANHVTGPVNQQQYQQPSIPELQQTIKLYESYNESIRRKAIELAENLKNGKQSKP